MTSPFFPEPGKFQFICLGGSFQKKDRAALSSPAPRPQPRFEPRLQPEPRFGATTTTILFGLVTATTACPARATTGPLHSSHSHNHAATTNLFVLATATTTFQAMATTSPSFGPQAQPFSLLLPEPQSNATHKESCIYVAQQYTCAY